MKKFIIIVASLVTLFLVATILIPVLFSDNIQSEIRHALDDNLEARVYYDPAKFDLTLFKSFPNPTASMAEFGIIGVNEFEGDTLLSVKSFNITIGLLSLFGESYNIKSINLAAPKINIRVLKNGMANYEIVTEAEEETVEGSTDTSPAFNISIDHWNISEGKLSYNDQSMDFFMLLEGLNHSGGGDISLDIYDLQTLTKIDKATVSYEGTRYLSDHKLFANAAININIPEFKFTFKENMWQVNDFPFSFNGYLAMPGEDIEMDISFATSNSSIKSLYSLIPGVYTQDFQRVEASGDMSFSGFIKGTYNDISLPAFHVKLNTSGGVISYPDLPMPIKNINIDMQVDCKDGNLDHTLIDIKQIHMDLGNNPIDGSLTVKNLKDFDTKADLSAKLDLEELSAIFPLEGFDMKGIFSLELMAEGVYDSLKSLIPSITAKMELQDGYIKSDELPKALDHFSFSGVVDGSSGKMEDMKVMIDGFKLTMGEEALSGSLLLKNMIDYQWNLSINGDLDLEVISEVYPIEAMKYSGLVSADIETEGKYSDVQQERYNRLSTKGDITLTNFAYRSADLPQGMKIENARVSMDPKQLKIYSFSGTVGKSDIQLDGFITNYINYLFEENAFLMGKMDLNSTLLDLNEWMLGEETAESLEEQEEELEVVVIPRNVDFEFKSSIKKILYDNLDLQNARGVLTVRDGVLDMSNLSFDMLGGNIVMNGKYNTQQPKRPSFDYQLNINSLSIPAAFKSFSTVQAFAPMAEHMNGNFSTNFNISGLLKEDMSPEYQSLNGKGLIQIAEAFMKDSKLVTGISGFMKSDMKSSQLSLKDVIMKASIENGRAYVSPFDVQVAGQKGLISGSIGADGTLNYNLSTEIEAGAVGQQINQLLANLKGQETSSADSKIKLNFNVGGTYDKPAISLAGTTSSAGTTTVKEEVKEVVGEQVNEVKKEAEQKVEDETRKLMEQGEEQLQEQLDTLKKEVTKGLEKEAGEVLSDELDSTANELKNTIKSLFKKKKKDEN